MIKQHLSTTKLAWENSWHFPRNDVWETSVEIPYWWRVTTQIQVLLLIGLSMNLSSQKHYPDLGSEVSSVWNFCARLSDVISWGNQCWRRREMSAVSYGLSILESAIPHSYGSIMVLKINASSKSKVCLRRLRRRIERLSFDQSLHLKWLLTNLTKIRNKQGQKNLIVLTNKRVATHQKDKNSLTFHWQFSLTLY